MPPIRGKKRKSAESTMSSDEEMQQNTVVDLAMGQKVPTKSGSPSASDESPNKKRKTGITLAQKKALIDNLQLEITERARKLRSNYNIQAQTLRTRVEIRLNRVPMALRKVTMGELLQKYSSDAQQPRIPHSSSSRGPPVPEKDIHSTLRHYPLQRSANILAMTSSPARLAKRSSRDMSGGDKENEFEYAADTLKKGRLGPAAEISRNPAQVLSPASSNSRFPPRSVQGSSRPTSSATSNMSPIKSGIARPVSPMKPTTIINNMVDKARGTTRGGATAASTTAAATKRGRAQTTSAVAPSNGGAGTASRATRTRGTTAAASRPATRTGTRRVSGVSESSEGSTSTVVRKRPGTAMSTKSAPGGTSAAPKKTVMGTIKKGVASASNTTRKAPAASKAAAGGGTASTTGTGRVLRRRG
ncbi:Nbl1 / Borealin N terminal domain containing protein [Naviculisporaceae sp. PSN 640]